MKRRTPALVLVGLATVVTLAAIRHRRWHTEDPHTAGGTPVKHATVYNIVGRWILKPFYRGIANDIAATVPQRARVLDVGCGPGHLATQLAQRGLDVTGVDLDPTMIEQARTNAMLLDNHEADPPTFHAADVIQLPFPDQTFDVVVSTLSMHHWNDPNNALSEIGRVLSPGGQVLIWDFKPNRLGRRPPNPVQHVAHASLRVIDTSPWRWPWRLSPFQRTVFERVADTGSTEAVHQPRPDG